MMKASTLLTTFTATFIALISSTDAKADDGLGPCPIIEYSNSATTVTTETETRVTVGGRLSVVGGCEGRPEEQIDDTRSATIDWGDGTHTDNVSVEARASHLEHVTDLTVANSSHTYTTAGTHQPSITVLNHTTSQSITGNSFPNFIEVLPSQQKTDQPLNQEPITTPVRANPDVVAQMQASGTIKKIPRPLRRPRSQMVAVATVYCASGPCRVTTQATVKTRAATRMINRPAAMMVEERGSRTIRIKLPRSLPSGRWFKITATIKISGSGAAIYRTVDRKVLTVRRAS